MKNADEGKQGSSEQAAAGHGHVDRHKEARERHVHDSKHAMSQQHDAKGRTQAFLTKQHGYLTSLLHQLRASGMVTEQVGDELQHELDVYQTHFEEIADGIAHGVTV